MTAEKYDCIDVLGYFDEWKSFCTCMLAVS